MSAADADGARSGEPACDPVACGRAVWRRCEPVSPGHDAAVDLALLQRAEALRRFDRRALRSLATWTLACAALLVVAAVAIPSFTPFRCRSRQSEAKANLKQLFVLQDAHFAEHDRYSDDADELGFAPKGARVRYAYFAKVGGTDAAGLAIGVERAVAGDVWHIDERFSLERP